MTKEFCVSFILISFSDEKIPSSDGKTRNVTKKETNKPSVIIQPKSIMGFIPQKLKIKMHK